MLILWEFFKESELCLTTKYSLWYYTLIVSYLWAPSQYLFSFLTSASLMKDTLTRGAGDTKESISLWLLCEYISCSLFLLKIKHILKNVTVCFPTFFLFFFLFRLCGTISSRNKWSSWLGKEWKKEKPVIWMSSHRRILDADRNSYLN